MKKLISMVLLLAMSVSAAVCNAVYAEETVETAKATLLADTYVDCRLNPDTVYGAEDCFFVRRSGVCTYGLLKFSLPSLEGKSVKSATLRLANRNDANAAMVGIYYFVSRLSADDWNEETITGKDVYSSYTTDGTYKFPAAGTEKVYTAYPSGSAKYAYVELDATSIISYDYLMGNSTTSLVIGTDTNNSTDGKNLGEWKICGQLFNSGRYMPELVLTLGEASYSELNVNGECIENNYTDRLNPDTVQTVGGIVLTAGRRDGYFKFDTSLIPDGFTVISANVSFPHDVKDDMYDGMLELYSIDNGWTEDTISYSNTPESVAKRAESTLVYNDSAQVIGSSFDITDYLQEKVYNGSTEISCKVESVYNTTIEGMNDNINIYGRTNAVEARRPKLYMTVSNDPDIADIVEDKANLTLPGIAYSSLTLPASGSNGSDISWTSSDPEVITAAGEVTRTDTDKTVTLTAHLTYNDIAVDKTFTILVPEVIPQGGKVTFYNTADNSVINEIGDAETAYATIKFTAPYTGNAQLITARYTSTGILSADVTPIEMTSGEVVSIKTNTINSSRASCIKLMIWDSMNGMTPVIDMGTVMRSN